MSGTKKILTCVFIAAATLAGGTASAQASCASVLPPSPEIWATGDVAYEPLVTQEHINNYWSAYAMESGDWDEGWGYSDCGNVNLPMARAFNAMWAVQFSAPPGAGGDNFLTYSHSYVVNAIDEIQTSCETVNTPVARTQWGSWQDDWTRLYLPFFFQDSVPVRASALVHEARHAQGVAHDAGADCPWGGSCDSSFDYLGAWRYEVIWLWWFAYTSPAPDDMRILAQQEANYILQHAFQTPPGFQI